MKTISFLQIRAGLRWIFICATASSVAASPAQIPVPPESFTIFNGNSAATPFDFAQPARFQQVYAASAFPSVALGGGWITEIHFRGDLSLGHFFEATIPNMQINMSTTSLLPDGLSPVFDSNVGADDTVVRAAGAVDISGGPGGTFEVGIAFSQPFFYNPANGNLLLDFRINQGIGGPNQGLIAVLDAFDSVGDSVSSVYARGPTLPTSGQTSSLGLATVFVFTPVPEPSSMAMLALGLGILGLGCRRIIKHKEEPNAAD